MRKFISAILTMSVLLMLCGCRENNAETVTETVSEISKTTTVKTTASTVTTTEEKTAAATVAETTTVPTETTVTETTVTKPDLPEPILPPEAVMIDTGNYRDGKKYNFSCITLDEENLLVLYTHYNVDRTYSAYAKIFSISDGSEKADIKIPQTEATDFLVKDGTYEFNDENILCKICSCKNEYDYGEYTKTLLTTIVYTDLSYESTERSNYDYKNYSYEMPGGRRIRESLRYGNVYDAESGELLLNAIYEGEEHKQNVRYGYTFPIDEDRFVYSMWGYEWCWGIGVYDFKTGTARDAPDTYDFFPLGVHGGKIYSVYASDGYTENVIYATDVNTLETTRLFEIAENDYAECYGMTPDGEFLFKAVKMDNENTSEFILYSADTMEIVRKYEFKNAYLQNYGFYFTEDGKAVLKDDKQKCLYILDLNK